ncbi:MAG: DNA repair protein RadA [Candidatus Nomurabacteria bacterium]|nr:MAG: DNA repair protein RadA [Candidatus Nomurabacteria bacterium]
MRNSTLFVCSKCDAQYSSWQGRCAECQAWGTLEPANASASDQMVSATKPAAATPLHELRGSNVERFSTGIAECDRVLGGGIVPGAMLLLAGAPGIGKSTLVLQLASHIAKGGKVLYVSGEESGEQVKLRLDRLGLSAENIDFISSTVIEPCLAAADKLKPRLIIFDSVQTLASSSIPSEAGTVGQVRTVTNLAMHYAKNHTVATLLIGHVTKEGVTAGPKTLEHLVDTVLSLEGDNKHQFRLLRSSKNRFGTTNEVGVFTLEEKGLREVANPSERFLEERQQGSGSVVTATMEGTRAWLAEIQALVNPSVFGMPRRSATGVDGQRLQLILAVLTRRAGLQLGTQDVFVNVVGGISVREPAADLAIALAVASAFRNVSFDSHTAMLGEIGLGGEVRSVGQIEQRVRELERMDFKRVLVSAKTKMKKSGIEIIPVATVKDAITALLPKA